MDNMDIFPNASELILAIFASLLSLVVSLFLIKIQRASNITLSRLTNEQKLLRVKSSEVRDLANGKIRTSKELRGALEFLENEAAILLSEIDKKIAALEKQKPIIVWVVSFGMVLMLLSLGSTFYLSYITDYNGGKVNFSTQITVIAVTIFALVYLGIEAWLVRRFTKDFGAVKSRLDYITSEIMKAIELVLKDDIQ